MLFFLSSAGHMVCSEEHIVALHGHKKGNRPAAACLHFWFTVFSPTGLDNVTCAQCASLHALLLLSSADFAVKRRANYAARSRAG